MRNFNFSNFFFISEEKGKSRLIREEDHDRSDDDESQDRIDMSINTDARDKEKRREAFLASQTPVKRSFLNVFHRHLNLSLNNALNNNVAVTDDESEHGNEEEEWEAQQIRKGVTGAQVNNLEKKKNNN